MAAPKLLSFRRGAARVGSENGPDISNTGPQRLAVTAQTTPSNPVSQSNSKTRLISGSRKGNGSSF